VVGRFGDDAVAMFDDLAREHGDSRDPQLRRRAAGALVNKAGLLWELERPDEASGALSSLIERYADDADDEMRELVDRARVQQRLLDEGATG
jgi:hypothetical protein